MVTVSFNIPEEVKNAFNDMFDVRNQNIIISDLMKRAIEEENLKRQRVQAVDALLAIRGMIPLITEQELRNARQENRP
ncbi:MAG: hypothetical protein BWK78_07800 [Thiotrichaceae bacterium IS1]|nr:MAG: hypothetical protein BWK78_07800 [Thiotrichaceae bacterium IS1]